MRRAVQHRRAPAAERQDAHDERQDEQHDLLGPNPRTNGPPSHSDTTPTAGIVSEIDARLEPSARLRLALSITASGSSRISLVRLRLTIVTELTESAADSAALFTFAITAALLASRSTHLHHADNKDCVRAEGGSQTEFVG